MCADKAIKVDVSGITPDERLQENSRKYSFFWNDDGRSIKTHHPPHTKTAGSSLYLFNHCSWYQTQIQRKLILLGLLHLPTSPAWLLNPSQSKASKRIDAASLSPLREPGWQARRINALTLNSEHIWDGVTPLQTHCVILEQYKDSLLLSENPQLQDF